MVPQQPSYLPWPNYFGRLWDADLFVTLDDVQFSEGGWQNRNHIGSSNGSGRRLLTIPVRKKGRFGQRICDVEIASQSWRADHHRAVSARYSGWPGFDLIAAELGRYYSVPYERLADASTAFLTLVMSWLGLDVPMVSSRELGAGGTKSQRLINICRLTDCSRIRVGAGAVNYLDVGAFHRANISVEVATDANWTAKERAAGTNRLGVLEALGHWGSQTGDVLHSRIQVCDLEL